MTSDFTDLSHQSGVPHSLSGHHAFRIDPKFRRLAYFYQKYMIFVALMASSFIYIQASTIVKNKSSENVSLASYIVFLIVAVSVFVYGQIWHERIIIASGLLSIIGAVFVIVATVSYSPTSNPGAFTTI